MYVIDVNKLQEFLWNVRRLFIYFFDDDAINGLEDFDDDSMFFFDDVVQH